MFSFAVRTSRGMEPIAKTMNTEGMARYLVWVDALHSGVVDYRRVLKMDADTIGPEFCASVREAIAFGIIRSDKKFKSK